MLAVKYQSRRIGDLPEEEFLLHSKSLIARISIITGWVIPDDKFYFNTLVSEFQKFLIERYSDLNADEITYAFRNYGTTVKDWGKSMNLSLIDEPITKYLAVRQCLSEIEERKKPPVEEKQIAPIANDDELIETVKSVFLKTNNTGLIPVKVYDILTERKLLEMENEQKLVIRKKIEARLNMEAFEGDNELKKMNRHDYEMRTRNECKKQAVAEYFKSL